MSVTARNRQQQRDGPSECGNLRQREVDEDDPPLDDMHAQVRMNPRENQARHERRGEKLQHAGIHSVVTSLQSS